MLLWQESVLTSLGFRFRESKRNRQRSCREPTEPQAQFPRSPLLGSSVNRGNEAASCTSVRSSLTEKFHKLRCRHDAS
jgi:hypothetical protein